MKRKDKIAEQENYLLPQDISDILEEFAPIQHDIKREENETTDSFVELMCKLVESAIHTRVQDLSRQRKIEKEEEFASAAARDREQTPRYFRPLRRLFIRTPNVAMDLINEREEQTARLKHIRQKKDNDELRREADELEEEYNRQSAAEEEDGEDLCEAAESEEDVAPLPVRKKRKKRAEQESDEEQADEAETPAGED